ncbi:HVO_2922 family protein [Halobellus rubicundus]|uniref:HVO_2922 family protein n=1 Tax=Halobellus rubicundus TaxID=2996466 RepID=A0ABD5MEG3_9EURY
MSDSDDGTLPRWYRRGIGRPETTDEVRGYWLFALGAVLGVLGLVLFLPSRVASPLREWAIVFAGVGLALVLAGPIIRLPLRERATRLTYVGLAVCFVAVVWFLIAFPDGWTRSRWVWIIGLYALGAIVIAAAGVFVPLVTPSATAAAESEREALREEVDDLRTALEDAGVEEAEAAETIERLREREADLSATVEQLREDVAGVEADEADLAARLRSLRSSSAQFELYEDQGGEYRWRLRHRNGNVIASSGEGYTARHNAQKGMQSVRRNALGATVLFLEDESELPEADEEFDPVEEAESQAEFELYEDRGGEYRWRLRHENGNLIAESSEGYTRRRDAKRAMDRVREYVGGADYLRFDPTAFETYRDAAGAWRWRLVHRNGNVLADSGEGYTRRRDAKRAIDRIREGIDDLSFERYEDAAGEYRWRLKSANGQILGDSGQGYADARGADEAVDRVREYAPEARVLDVGEAAFEIYEDRGGEYRWRLRHRNGNILADSGQGYAERRNAREGVESVKRNAPNAELESADEADDAGDGEGSDDGNGAENAEGAGTDADATGETEEEREDGSGG